MIAHRSTKLQPALFPHLENSTKVESPAQRVSPRELVEPTANTLAADPLIDETRQARRRAMARTLCQNAATPAAWAIADRLATAWQCGGCAALGVGAPADPEGARRRR